MPGSFNGFISPPGITSIDAGDYQVHSRDNGIESIGDEARFDENLLHILIFWYFRVFMFQEDYTNGQMFQSSKLLQSRFWRSRFLPTPSALE
jgi:hypothetical protein